MAMVAVAALALAAMAMPLACAVTDDPKKVDNWFNRLSHAERKTTCLHFFHDTISGKSPTAVRVAEPTITKKSPTLFRVVNMMDDPLTEGLEPESPLVGRAQGLYGSAGLESLGLLMNMNLVFTSPKYNGSTLSTLGRNPAYETYREMLIVGGTGFLRLASGIATVEYNVIVMHY
ncbi:hypothetical protein EUGRSUZ_I01390 [Eucalyptus grandis]|uniref:Uncharacterized protein n=2 Tax=Eucalyptus grandis TaxID=71139 RepID=A0ACC3JG31_EUCGR|nr:hypothetical protein EUGRSUZ_I01390 [Eucalyptus grandis]